MFEQETSTHDTHLEVASDIGSRPDIKAWLVALEDPNALIRREAWAKLARLFQTIPNSATVEIARRLISRQAAEPDKSAWQNGLQAILLAMLQLHETPQIRSGKPQPRGLGEWIWHTFRRNARVLWVADPDRFRRDEEAVIEIARSLPLNEFRPTDFMCVDLRGFGRVRASFDSTDTFCFVGRFWLFGREDLSEWAHPASELRYRFPLEERPKDLPRGKLDPDYHSIVSRIVESDGEGFYQTEESNGKRTDYGLIQRYVVHWNGRRRVVIHIAGCSALGTKAAAHYAAYTLLQPDLKGDMPLPLPPQIDHNSQMEILIKAVADLEGAKAGWKVDDLTPIDIRVGDYVWNQDANVWHHPGRDVITLEFPSARTKRDYHATDEGARIFFGTKKPRFNSGSENCRLATALCMLAERQENVVELNQLGRDEWIWQENETKSNEHVRKRLGSLRRVFGTAITIENDECRVIPRIEPIVKKPK